MIDVIKVQKAEFWRTFALALTLPSDKLQVRKLSVGHGQIRDWAASSIESRDAVQGKAIMSNSGKRNADI